MILLGNWFPLLFLLLLVLIPQLSPTQPLFPILLFPSSTSSLSKSFSYSSSSRFIINFSPSTSSYPSSYSLNFLHPKALFLPLLLLLFPLFLLYN